MTNGISDHDVVISKIRFFKPKIKLTKRPASFRIGRNYRNLNKIAFQQDLENKPWYLIEHTNDLDVAVGMFTDFLTQAINDHAPMKRFPVRRRKSLHLSPKRKEMPSKQSSFPKTCRSPLKKHHLSTNV